VLAIVVGSASTIGVGVAVGLGNIVVALRVSFEATVVIVVSRMGRPDGSWSCVGKVEGASSSLLIRASVLWVLLADRWLHLRVTHLNLRRFIINQRHSDSTILTTIAPVHQSLSLWRHKLELHAKL
jgi:hypothetical protein